MPNRTLRVLNVEDSEPDVALLTRHLSCAGYDVISERVEMPAAMRTALETQDWDVILCDYSMPHFNALSALALLKETELDIAFIVISGTVGEAVAVEAMRAGAHDYLMKDSLMRLVPAIEREMHEAENRRARRRAEEALREAHNRLSFHVDNTPLAVIEWDSDSRVSRWSPSAERIFGWKAEEVLGKRVNDWQFVFPDDLDLVDEVISRQRNGIEQHRLSRNRNYTKDGSVLHCQWYNSVLCDRSGKLGSVLSLVLNVTARKLAEDESARFLALEQQARGEAEHANRLKDEFLATVSHELRTPLTSILGWAQLLSTGDLDSGKHGQAYETILRNARSQVQLIDDLLDVSRIITGQIRLDVRPLELAPIIEAAVNSVRPAALRKEIRVQLILDPHVGQVSGDPDRLQQVIWNLLSNAIKFTPGGGRVQISLERFDSCAAITVSDTGQGMKLEFVPYVFDRFRQADGSSTRQHKGLGLGLAIVRHLVELHGGTIHAASDGVEAGSTFTVKLPLLMTRDQTIPPGEAVEHTKPPAGYRESFGGPELDGLRVLIVDDDADSREIVTMMLERCHAEAMTADSASAALEMLETWRPDILVADIGMPIDDGYLLIRKLRCRPAHEGGRTPALALTAYTRTEDRVRILSAGYQMHLAKPVEATELIAAVANLAKHIT